MDEGLERENPLLMMEGITKSFPGVLALSKVSLSLYPGEILGLIGENGAGKSTLINILGGLYTPDEGRITISGRALRPGSVQSSLASGISIIHQELNLACNLDVASNIYLGREPTGGLGRVRNAPLREEALRLTRLVGLNVQTTSIVEDLSPAQQQLVEIAKALSISSKILVLDEPTSSLSPTEAEALFTVMRSLKASGVSMIYISHRLHEIEEMCDRVTVLRDGVNAGELQKDEINRDSMVRLMVGRDVSRFFPESVHHEEKKIVLSVKSLRRKSIGREFSFDLHEGEVLGLAGLMGAGRTELVRSLFGVDPPVGGEIRIHDAEVTIRSPLDAIKHGIALVPEDRKELGLLLEMSVKENISLPSLLLNSGPVLDSGFETRLAEEQVRALSIKTPSLRQAVMNLSGGNQQKVSLGKWLALSPKILILDEPTRGIDVGSKSEIYKLIRNLADEGMAVIMISSEMEEIIGLCDRVIVMHEGCIRGFLNHDELTEEKIMHLATGSTCS